MTELGYSKRGDGIFYLEDPISPVGKEQVAFLRRAVGRTTKGRARLCAHAGEDDALHEMLILLRSGGYVRPHRHLGKSESLHVIEGSATIVLFSESGEPERVFNCGAPPDSDCFFYRISEPVFHTQLVRTPYFAFHEVTRGPFRREETEYAPWAPPEQDAKACQAYLAQLESRLSSRGGSA